MEVVGEDDLSQAARNARAISPQLIRFEAGNY